MPSGRSVREQAAAKHSHACLSRQAPPRQRRRPLGARPPATPVLRSESVKEAVRRGLGWACALWARQAGWCDGAEFCFVIRPFDDRRTVVLALYCPNDGGTLTVRGRPRSVLAGHLNYEPEPHPPPQGCRCDGWAAAQDHGGECLSLLIAVGEWRAPECVWVGP